MYHISLTNLSVNFDDHFFLNKINWKLNDAQHWVITGPNGSGKSALAATLIGAGEIEPDLFEGLAFRSGRECRVVRFGPASGERHLARPRVAILRRPLNEQQLGTAITRAEHRSDRGAGRVGLDDDCGVRERLAHRIRVNR